MAIHQMDQGGPNQWGFVTLLPCEFGDLGRCGETLDLDEDLILFGSPGTGSDFGRGMVYVYERSPQTGVWAQTHSSNSGGGVVSLSPSAFATIGEHDEFVEPTAVRIFRRQSNPLGWFLEKEIITTANDLAIRSDHLAVVKGAYFCCGTLEIFREDHGGTGNWGLTTAITDNSLNVANMQKVSWLSDDRLATASHFKPSPWHFATPSESVSTFQRTPNGEWTHLQTYEHRSWVPNHEQAVTGLGSHLAASGDLLLAGSPSNGLTVDNADVGQVVEAGRIIVFSLPFFADGFESGDVLAWTETTP